MMLMKNIEKEIVIKINGMSCAHCVKMVEEAIYNIANVKSVKVYLAEKNATIKYDNEIDLDEVKNCLEKLGYEIEN